MAGTAMRLMVCEPRPRWSRLLREVAADEEIPLQELRGLEQVWSALEEAPHSVLCLHVTRDSFVRRMSAVQRMKQKYPIVVVALPARTLQPWVWRAREFGTDDALVSALELCRLAVLIRRHRNRPHSPADTGATSRESSRDRVWRRLPWKGHATGGG